MMNTKQAAKVIGVDASHLRRMVRNGRIPATIHELPDGRRCYSFERKHVRRAATAHRYERRGRPRKTR